MSDRRARAEAARNRARALEGQKVEIAVAPCLFPTPPEIARYVVELAGFEPGMTVLEPSAGTGALLDEIPKGCKIVAIEIDYALARGLSRRYESRPEILVIRDDFLCRSGQYDRIIMNPPFDHGSDIIHIEHARELLAPGGRLVAICADGPRQRAAFAEADLYEPLPEGAFAAQGTGVRTAIVILEASA
jgi:protein-L-isoaspartate O-methyltransferase